MGKVQTTTKAEEETRLAACVERATVLDRTIRALKSEAKAKEGALEVARGELSGLLAAAELGEIEPETLEAAREKVRSLKIRLNEIPLATMGLQAREKETFRERTLAQKRVWRFMAEDDYVRTLAKLKAEGWNREIESDLFSVAAEVGKRPEAEQAVREAKKLYERKPVGAA